MPAAVVVGGLHHLALRRLRRDGRRVAELDADEGRHRAHPDRHRLLHGTAADTHEPHRIRQRERAGRRQRRIFPDRMAGDELGIARQIHSGFGLKHAHRRERHRDQRRLCILGQRDLLRRSLPHDGAELVAERGIDLLEDRAGGGIGLRQRLAHADRLAALPRENESGRHSADLS